jgi:hypothetical protein
MPIARKLAMASFVDKAIHRGGSNDLFRAIPIVVGTAFATVFKIPEYLGEFADVLDVLARRRGRQLGIGQQRGCQGIPAIVVVQARTLQLKQRIVNRGASGVRCFFQGLNALSLAGKLLKCLPIFPPEAHIRGRLLCHNVHIFFDETQGLRVRRDRTYFLIASQD